MKGSERKAWKIKIIKYSLYKIKTLHRYLQQQIKYYVAKFKLLKNKYLDTQRFCTRRKNSKNSFKILILIKKYWQNYYLKFQTIILSSSERNVNGVIFFPKVKYHVHVVYVHISLGLIEREIYALAKY